MAIKESSGDWNNFYATLLAVRDHLRVFCGPSSIFGVPAVLLGADGTIDCFPNVWAPGGLDLYHAARAGRLAEAERLQALGRQLTDLFTTGGRTLYPATKAAMDLLGLPGGGRPRPAAPALGRRTRREGLSRGLIAGAGLRMSPRAQDPRWADSSCRSRAGRRSRPPEKAEAP